MQLEGSSLIVDFLSLAFVLLAVYGARLFFIRSPKPDSPLNRVGWGALDALAAVVAVLLASQMVALGIAWVLFDFLSVQISSAQQQFIMMATSQLLAIGLVFRLLQRRHTATRLIGWMRPKWQDVQTAIVGYAKYFVIFLVVVLLAQVLAPGVDVNQRQALGFEPGAAGIELVFIFIALAILPPFAEELLFRGVLYTGLRTKLSALRAGAVTSILFALGHLQGGVGGSVIWLAALDTFILSMVLSDMREKSGSLWPGILVHMLKNSIAFAVLFVFRA